VKLELVRANTAHHLIATRQQNPEFIFLDPPLASHPVDKGTSSVVAVRAADYLDLAYLSMDLTTRVSRTTGFAFLALVFSCELARGPT
jgi:hypothetical protein